MIKIAVIQSQCASASSSSSVADLATASQPRGVISKRDGVFGRLICPAGTDDDDFYAPCPLCGTGDPVLARWSRFPGLWARQDSCPLLDPESCTIDSASSKRDDLHGEGLLPRHNDAAFDRGATSLEPGNGTAGEVPANDNVSRTLHVRANTMKTVPLFDDLVLDVGRYAPCSDVMKPKSKSKVEKYFMYADTSMACNPTIIKADKTTLSRPPYNCKPRFQTDHVYEAKTFANFFIWLVKNENVGDYTLPTKAWVKEALLGIDSGSGNPVFKMQPNPGQHYLKIPKEGAAPDIVMAYGFGRSDGVDDSSNGVFTKARGEMNLALAQTKDAYINHWYTVNKDNREPAWSNRSLFYMGQRTEHAIPPPQFARW